jgi:hypothetical protein
MVQVNFTSHLEVFFPKIISQTIEANNLTDLLKKLNQIYPGITSYLLEDNGSIRKHVNIFLDGIALINKDDLSVSLENINEVFIMQALSGG